jgi:hypothetical protein
MFPYTLGFWTITGNGDRTAHNVKIAVTGTTAQSVIWGLNARAGTLSGGSDYSTNTGSLDISAGGTIAIKLTCSGGNTTDTGTIKQLLITRTR